MRHQRGGWAASAGLVLAVAGGGGVTDAAHGQVEAARHSWLPRLLGAQLTLIGQDLAPFSAAYRGSNSLRSNGDAEATHTYGIYFGSRLSARLQVYLDIEMARGAAVGNAVGLGGITNGDVIRQGSVQLGQGPYVARGYLRYSVPLSGELDTVSRAMDQLPGLESVARLEIKVGNFALTDDFDQNRYANSTRTQFCDWGLFNNTAWDYAADTRGYTYGVLVAWVNPRWTLRFGRGLMPRFANGNALDWDLRHARGDNLELTLHPDRARTILRLLAYENHARMGIYREALAQGQRTGQTPDIVADDQPGRRKYGFGLNLEQPLADAGETGALVSGGLQLTGARWHRAEDRLGIAFVMHGLSSDHRAYLAAGGKGFLLGDGRLSYGPEQILETYYRLQLGRYAQLSPGFQFVDHPGYNRDRGPAALGTLRLNLRY